MEEKKTMAQWLDAHPKLVFWLRMAFWTIFACVLPFLFIVWRFELFSSISKIKVGGWGIIAIVILVVFIFTVIRYIKIVLNTKYSLTSQILNGFCKVILPLLGLYAIIYSVKSDIDLMLQAMGVVILSEMVAIPLNPLPKWAYEAQKEVKVEERKETADYLINTFFSKKEEKEGKN